MKTLFEGLGAKDFVTLAGLACGVAAVSRAFTGQAEFAVALIGLAAVFDFLDGKVAREDSSHNALGRELDSLCDAVSFGAAPIALAFSLQNGLLIVVAAVLYGAAGVVRLANYNVFQSGQGFYRGLPIPVAAIAVAAFAMFAPSLLVPVLLIMAAAMVADVRIRKIL
ncbi:CDP-alcohol phosphatidyltransferase family protein [Candidatus Micrarchaeota archaeon]|nr:CDP-alcohol phosphatidyltransferase family protein [Candidatus Micrarchaeota archaeon]MBI5177547.1 CDP-alcohol phosphatidyltransferase family protein [Candidatus Micrarchaeota archaeon]